MLVLSHADVAALLDMPACIEVIETALKALSRGEYFQPLRQRFRSEQSNSRFVLLPAARVASPRLWGLKEIVVAPSNSARGLDPHQGAVLLHDGEDGQLLAVLHAGAITAIRTAAASAVATRALAPQATKRVLIAGSGVQARTHIAAIRSILPEAAISLWGRSQEKAALLATELDCSVATSLERAVRDSQVICTVTASSEPIIKREWVSSGCHINAVGSSLPTARELDGATMAAATLIVDRTESTLNESGDYLLALREGAIGSNHIRAELGDVLCGKATGRTREDEITIFKSLGFGTLDLAAAEYVYHRAVTDGQGQRVSW